MKGLRYRAVPSGRWFPIVLFLGVFVVGLVACVAGAVANPEQRTMLLGFAAFYAFAGAWNGYWILKRTAFEVELVDDRFRFRTALTPSEVPLSQVVRIRPGRLLPGSVVVEHEDGRPVIVAIQNKGFGELVDAIAAKRPDLPIKLGILTKSLELMPGFNGIQKISAPG